MRIVTLLPAATEMVCALGLRDSLVGRSHECDFPADVAGLPALTQARVDSSLSSERLDAEVRRILAARLPLYRLDEERLAALAPDVVVTQEACEVCAVSYAQVVGSLERTACRAEIVSSSPTRLGEILWDLQRVAQACGVPGRGIALRAELEARLGALASRRPAERPRVAVIEWLAPPMLAGHWVPEAIAAAGGEPVGPATGAPSPYTTWEAIHALEPDALVVAPCGFDLPRTAAEAMPVADVLRVLAPRVLFLDGNAYLNRPGPRIVDAAETIGAWLRGEAVARERGLDLASLESDAVRATLLDGGRPGRAADRV